MKPQQRLLLMLPVLAVAGWLALFGDKTPPDAQVVAVSTRARPVVESSVAPTTAEAAEPAPSAEEELAPGQIRQMGSRKGLADQGRQGQDLFGGVGAEPPAAPPAASENVAPPPEQPFTLIGRMLEDGRWTVFLERNGHAWALSRGEQADGFRVEAISSREVRLIRLSDKAVFVIPIDGDKKD